MKNKIKVLTFSVFAGYIIHIEITKDLKKSVLKYDETKKHINEVTETTLAICIHGEESGITFMFLPPKSSIGIIVHESWHAVKNLMGFVGIELDSETVAYHLGYVADIVFNLMRGKK